MMPISLKPAHQLLDRLEDPFTMFPVESVSDTLFEAVDKVEILHAEGMGDWGVARKYWTVQDEHHHEEIGLLVGAVFVLGQAAITQSLSILNELRKHPAGQRAIPPSKAGILAAHAAEDAKTKLSKIVIINTAANYFKHVYEWPDDWNNIPVDGPQKDTINTALRLGMKPDDMTDNLFVAARCLGLSSRSARAIATTIQDWRESWARVLYPAFGIDDPNRRE